MKIINLIKKALGIQSPSRNLDEKISKVKRDLATQKCGAVSCSIFWDDGSTDSFDCAIVVGIKGEEIEVCPVNCTLDDIMAGGYAYRHMMKLLNRTEDDDD